MLTNSSCSSRDRLLRKRLRLRARFFFRVTGWVLFFAYMILAASLLLVRLWVMPDIEKFFPKLEAYLEEQTGTDISVASIKADWDFLRPRITLNKVTFAQPGQRASLTLPQVQATFSYLSFFELKPILARLIIVNPDLHIERQQEHVFNIAGFTVRTEKENDSSSSGDHTQTVIDWLLEQDHLEIVKGRFSYVDFTDPHHRPVRLRDTHFMLHRYITAWSLGLQSYVVRESETPLDIRANFKEKWFGSDNRLEKLYGTIYASVPYLNFGTIASRINLDHIIDTGRGAVNLWLDFDRLRPERLTADIALHDVSVRANNRSDQNFRFDSLQGRLIQTLNDEGRFTLETQDLIIKPIHRSAYYLGDTQIEGTLRDGTAYDGKMKIEFFDLRSLTTIGLQLPIPEEILSHIRAMQPEGLIENFEGSWTGPINNPTHFEVASRFKGLTLKDHENENPQKPGFFGFKNLTGEFTANNDGGTLTLDSPSSTLSFPGVFFEKNIALDTLKMRASWELKPTLRFNVEDLIVSNADASAQVHGGWYDTGGAGTLEVRGDLHYLRASAAHRFIPIVAGGKATNDWLKAALRGGIAKNGTVNIYGPLDQFPFEHLNNSDFIFHISGDAENVLMDYVPSYRHAKDGDWIPGEWPRIEKINGRLIFEGNGMRVENATAESQGVPIHNVTASIPSFTAKGVPLLIHGVAEGSLANMASFVNESPVSAMLSHVFKGAELTGQAQLDLKLNIPITEAHDTAVQGDISLSGNRVVLTNVPPLDNASGSIYFTEKGLWANSLTATVYGEPATGSIDTNDGKIAIEVHGRVTPTSIASIVDNPSTDALMKHVTGQTQADVAVTIDHGVSVQVTSDLVGLESQMPAPFNKSKETPVPLTFSYAPCSDRQCSSRMKLSIGKIFGLGIDYATDKSGHTHAHNGVIAVGQTLPAQHNGSGLAIFAKAQNFNYDNWQSILSDLNNAYEQDSGSDIKSLSLSRAAIAINNFSYHKLNFRNVNINAQIGQGNQWSGTIASDLAKGTFAFVPERQQSHALLRANFDYLHVPQPQVIVDEAMKVAPQYTESLPSIELTIKDLQYQHYQLGQLRLQATNTGRGASNVWHLNQFEVSTDEAKLTASGSWDAGKKERSQTQLEATLDVNDLGILLQRFDMQHAVNDGAGQINAQLNWPGAPVDFATESLMGEMSVLMRSGQILQVEPGAGRLLSLLSLQTLLRRLTLDFRDVVGQGFVFDSISSSIAIAEGILQTNDFRIVGPQATVLSEGHLDLNTLSQNFKITVLPDISLGGASLALAVANPILGVGSFLAQLALQTPLSQLFSVEYQVTGTIDNPVIEKVSDSENRQTTASPQ